MLHTKQKMNENIHLQQSELGINESIQPSPNNLSSRVPVPFP